MIWTDEIVDEVRRVREAQAEKFNYDIAAICADMRQQQATSKRRVVTSLENEEKPETTETLQAA
jgi:hypothetical protein